MRNNKNILSIFTVLFVFASVFFLQGDLKPIIEKGGDTISQTLGRASSAVLPLITQETPLTPGPLKVIKKVVEKAVSKNNEAATSANAVTLGGIITETNNARASQNLPPLSQNKELDASALVKVKDMFAQQYFEHTSPNGSTVVTLVSDAGYDYIVVGENLALGNFESSKEIVDAWMNSPGHRANILNTRFTEIGVGVLEGSYQGETMWLAVQHFGLPRSSCPEINVALKKDIDENQNQIDADNERLDELRKKMDEEGSTDGSPYTATVEEYNNLVTVYNNLLKETQNKIAVYNKEINALNSCIQG